MPHPNCAYIPSPEEYDQNQFGICECESLAGALATLGVRVGSGTPGGASPPSPLTLARLTNYHRGVVSDGGCRWIDAVEALSTYGVDAYRSDECDDGQAVTMRTPVDSELLERATRHRYQIEWQCIDPHGPDAWDEICDALARGLVCQCEFGVTPEFEAIGVNEPALPATLSGPDTAGHSVLIRGYNRSLNVLFGYTSWRGFDRWSRYGGLVPGGFVIARESVPALWAIRVIVGVNFVKHPECKK
jgi:hypothetical protein